MTKAGKPKIGSPAEKARKNKVTKARNDRLYKEVRRCLDKYSHVYLFSVENMRNTFLRDVRQEWITSRLLFGRNAVMAKALGKTEEAEYKTGLAALAAQRKGNVGLLFTDAQVATVQDYFGRFVRSDYARSGCTATETISLPKGPLLRQAGGLGPEAVAAARADPTLLLPFPHNMEPRLRALGLPTKLDKGIVTLVQEHVLCTKGQTLTPQQAHLLKHFYHQSVQFQVWRALPMGWIRSLVPAELEATRYPACAEMRLSLQPPPRHGVDVRASRAP